MCLALSALLSPGLAFAAPVVGNGGVTSGVATIGQSGSVTNVNQSSNKAVINWQSFGTAPGETVNFNQPNASAVTLNRVIGNEKSVLQGALNATGKVFLINSNGVLFTKGSTVNTGGFVASTLNLTDADFNAGNYVFKANGGTGSIINLGTITARDGGYVSLLGNAVSNQGVITATKGSVALASGNKVTLNFNGDSLLSVTIDEGTLSALVENRQAIYADGGQVIMTAKAADELLSAQVNNTGIVQARTVGDLTGHIEIYAHGGTANVAGTLDASAPTGGNGGFIETSGDQVKIADSATITTHAGSGNTGNWLIDPNGFTIGTGGDITGAALGKQLASNNVTLQSTDGKGADGNINVNDAVTWSANKLTLTATNNVYVNNVMTATGTAGFAANYGRGTNADGTPNGLYTFLGTTDTPTALFAAKINFSGTGGVALNGETYTVISDANQLAAARNQPNGRYVLGGDLDAGSISWTVPLDNGTAFTGKFNGLGHVLNGFNPTATSLFGTIGSTASVTNIGIINANVSANAANPKTSAGILADVNQGTIVNSYASGTLNTSTASTKTVIQAAGGLVGINSGLIAQSYTQAAVNGVLGVGGGLVGINQAAGRIIDSSARGSASAQVIAGTADTIKYTGGLVGVNQGRIDRSYALNRTNLTGAAASATSNAISGGFVGLNTGIIDQSYSSPNAFPGVTVGRFVAGFVGENTGTISNAYATSTNTTQATASWDAGFAYKNSGTITNAYAISNALGTKQRYGFVFDNTGGTITNAYWSTKQGAGTPVVIDTSAAKNLTAAQAPVFSSYTGFDPAIWSASASGFPILRNMLVYVRTRTVATYGDATSSLGTLGLEVQGLQGGGGNGNLIDGITNAAGKPFTVTTNNGYVDAGTFAATDILSSTSYANFKGVVSVNPKALRASGVVIEDKVYDGTTAATVAFGGVGASLSGMVGDQTASIVLGSTAFADKNVGTNKSVNLTLADGSNGGKASNYVVIDSVIGNVTPKAITATATGNSRVYDGTTGSTLNTQLAGAVAGDDLSLDYTANFADKNVGKGKAIGVSGLALDGADSGNYTLQTTTLQTVADITPLVLNLSGTKPVDGNNNVSAANLVATNVVAGDTVGLGGSVTIAGAAAGAQAITNLGALTNNNPNYTLVGSVGAVAVGGGNLVLDHVASGGANISTSGNTTTVNQTTDKAIIDWLRFSVGANETINFVQPSATSIVLNRVIGNEASAIAGALRANGRVFILNTNGVLFAAGSRVNVAGLVASTLNVDDTDFINNNYLFTSTGGSGSVVAAGDIVIVAGGFVALASGNGVSQTGALTANNGTAILAGANRMTLALNTADNGVGAYSVSNLAGTSNAGGFIDVSSVSGNGGTVAMAGTQVSLAGDLALNTGSRGNLSLTQQNPVTIGNGGTFSSQFVSNNLAVRNLRINSAGGDISVNEAVNWSADTTLGLAAANNINVNADIAASGANAGLALNYGNDYIIRTPASYSGVNAAGVADQAPAGTTYAKVDLTGAKAKLDINGNSYTLIHSLADLAAISGTTGRYALASNLDASGKTYTTAVTQTLDGTFAGLGHVVDKLTIVSPDSNVGLFGATTAGSLIRDIGVSNADITGGNFVGALVGANLGNISKTYSTGKVSGSNVGGLIGLNGAIVSTSAGPFNTISDSFSDAVVYGNAGGGLLGRAGNVTISRCHATGSVAALGGSIGGLVGSLLGLSNVFDSYATGNVSGAVDAVTGAVIPGNINFATSIGGLIGDVTAGGPATQYIQNSYASGNVSGASQLGGLIGGVSSGSADFVIDHAHATRMPRAM